ILLVFLPCVVLIPMGLLIPAYQRQRAVDEEARMAAAKVLPAGIVSATVDWDESKGVWIDEITAFSTSAAQFGSPVVYKVDSKPFTMQIAPGQYTFRITAEKSGKTLSIAKPVTIRAGEPNQINLSPDIEQTLSDGWSNSPWNQLQDQKLPSSSWRGSR